MYQLVLVRHGESEWNKTYQYTGWTDVDLTEKGLQDARNMGRKLKNLDFHFDIAYTSFLKRANVTLEIILETIGGSQTEIVKDWRLNERHYGALQGKFKMDTIEELGWRKVHAYRRSYSTVPPLLDLDDKRHPQYDSMYNHIDPAILPRGESMEDTYHRVVPYFTSSILSSLPTYPRTIISAHGNTLRVLLKYLDELSDTEIEGIEFGIGDILVYNFDHNYKIISKHIISEATHEHT